MLAEFLGVVPQTPSLVLVTYRSEYRGVLSQVGGAQTITLAPLDDSETTALASQLLGDDPSVSALADLIADRAAYLRAIFYVYAPAISNGTLRPDDHTMHEIEDALQKAERAGDDLALAQVRMALGVALVHRKSAAERIRGYAWRR